MHKLDPVHIPGMAQTRQVGVLLLVHGLEQLPRRSRVVAHAPLFHGGNHFQGQHLLGARWSGEAGDEDREDDETVVELPALDDVVGEGEDFGRGLRDFVAVAGRGIRLLSGPHAGVRVDDAHTI